MPPTDRVAARAPLLVPGSGGRGRARRTRGHRLAACATLGLIVALAPVVPIDTAAFGAASPGAGAAQPAAGGAPASGLRDVWFIVFDRYGSSESIRYFSGARNDQPAWLRSHGFQVADDAHANYVRTSLSLAATLNLDYLDPLAARMGSLSNDLAPLHGMLQHDMVGRAMKARGYRYVHLGSWFGPTATNALADQSYVFDPKADVEPMVPMTGSIAGTKVLVSSNQVLVKDRVDRNAALWQFQELDRIRQEPGPKYVFAHILLPHDPYVFDASGAYPSGPERKQASGPQYARQLAFANDRMRELVTALQDVPAAQQPIIIIEADEGPYPDRFAADTAHFDWAGATPQELHIKYGILLAMYLPIPGGPGVWPTMTPVNTFRLLFDRLFDARLPLLPDHSYTSASYTRPYAFSDVTSRLGVSGDPPAAAAAAALQRSAPAP
jgi:hypothetical protein